jgi:D-glycero-alpha-D-manno-heptose 1-phosphate guanylyltransferase
LKEIEAIILAGGLGTRLRSIVNDLPKCMAPVNDKPFIYYVIKNLQEQGVTKFIFSLGYKHKELIEYINTLLPNSNKYYIVEDEPLGTGGAIKNAYNLTKQRDVIITNGDTLFKVDIKKLLEFHKENNSDCTLSLKPMFKFDRYGVVELNHMKNISLFKEKKYYESGLINGGFYVLNMKKFVEKKFNDKFSFEKEYIEKFYLFEKIFGVITDSYFIDIGIPEDYIRAQLEFSENLF